MTRKFESPQEVATALIDRLGQRIVLGLPVGIGKAVHIADALFERAAADPALSLTIFSGLTLEPPVGRNELETRFLGPLVQRLYPDWPTPLYAKAVREGSLPPNIEVHEFYLRPGAYLTNPLAQRSYASINYSQVAAALIQLGVNVIGQLVAPHTGRDDRYSLSSNPEVTLDLLPHLDALREAGKAAFVGQVNRSLPYMHGDAELSGDRFDFILDSDDCQFAPFSIPNRSVSIADYATGMHVASLIPDGGTLQVGIGSLSDALAHCLWLRNDEPDLFAGLLAELPGGSRSRLRAALPIETGPFERGLYAATELLSDAMYSLFERGIIRRPADEDDHSVIHAGFFIGSSNFYQSLCNLPADRSRLIAMSPISFVNTLFGDEQRKRRQRQHGRFVNETMMATLLGAAVSDALDDGRVVSGVGGQFDFVSMAHALDDAQSILMVRARRVHDGKAQSNVRWRYAHATVPRHHRDVFVSEYGVAATRSRSDEQVIEAMLAIADAAFQPALMQEAVSAGKLSQSFAPDEEAKRNTPARLEEIFLRDGVRDYFPSYPLGTDLTDTEQQLAAALQWLKEHTGSRFDRLRTLAAAALGRNRCEDYGAALARLGLTGKLRLSDRLLQRLVSHALREAET